MEDPVIAPIMEDAEAESREEEVASTIEKLNINDSASSNAVGNTMGANAVAVQHIKRQFRKICMDEDTDFSQAKSYLQTTSCDQGNVYDHLVNVVQKLLTEKPSNGLGNNFLISKLSP